MYYRDYSGEDYHVCMYVCMYVQYVCTYVWRYVVIIKAAAD